MTFGTPSSEIPWVRGNLPYSEWAEDVLEFYGPPTTHCLGVPYQTLTHGGLKSEGGPIPGPLIWNEAEAWHLFKWWLAETCGGATQIAWRIPPNAQQAAEGNWSVMARLAWPASTGAAA